MIEFTDRVPTTGKENRYKITNTDGTVEYVTLERADDANPVGTPLNKLTFETMQTELMPVVGTYVGDNNDEQIIDLGFTPSIVMIFSNSNVVSYRCADCLISQNISTEYAEITENGFIVRYDSSSYGYNYSYNGPYAYIAWR